MNNIIKDKYNEKYEINILGDENKYKNEIISKINNLWIHKDIKLLNNLLTKKYSPDDLPTTFVVTKNGQLIGFCSILRKDVSFREDIYPWFGNCFVNKDFRRRGIMNKMQEHACDFAREKGYKKLYLWSEIKNLYVKSGWEYLEKIDVDEITSAYLCVKKL